MANRSILPAAVRRSMSDIGRGISVARRRRKLTAAMMAERTGISRETYRRVERGDPSVAMGTYLMACFVLGLDWQALARAVDPMTDELGSMLDIAALPKRVRTPRIPQPK